MLLSKVPPNTITRRFPGRCEERLRSIPPWIHSPEPSPEISGNGTFGVDFQKVKRLEMCPPCQTGLGVTADQQAFRGQWCPWLPWMQRGQDSNNGPIESDRAGISEEFRGCEEVLTMQLSRPRTGVTVHFCCRCVEDGECEGADLHPAIVQELIQEPEEPVNSGGSSKYLDPDRC